MKDEEQEDPEIVLTAMKERARDASNDLIPILMEKAINGKTKDAVKVFESLANRGGFIDPTQNSQVGPQGPLITLNINANDMTNMLQGLKTITQTGINAETNAPSKHSLPERQIEDKAHA